MHAGAGFPLEGLGVSGASSPNQLYKCIPGSAASTEVLIPAQSSDAAKGFANVIFSCNILIESMYLHGHPRPSERLYRARPESKYLRVLTCDPHLPNPKG